MVSVEGFRDLNFARELRQQAQERFPLFDITFAADGLGSTVDIAVSPSGIAEHLSAVGSLDDLAAQPADALTGLLEMADTLVRRLRNR